MRVFILILAWVSPALIAEMLGWKGIWGSGSAFLGALIPLPVSGGIFHVVSFAVASTVILSEKQIPPALRRFVPIIAAAVFVWMLALQIDFDRLNAYLFTDYKPFGSPIRFDSNLLYLFITTDAFWVFLYAILKGMRPPVKCWIIIPLVPICVIGMIVVKHKFSGPEFKIGRSFSGNKRGQEIHLVHTSGGYDKKALLKWFASKGYLARPWQSPNYEHSAVFFTSSMQAIKWGKLDLITEKNTIATLCLYEEDESMILHKGYADCFAGRDTLAEKLKKKVAANPTGFGKHIDYWYAQVMHCKDLDIPPGYVGDIAQYNMCKLTNDNYEKRKQQFTNLYGSDSSELRFVESTAKKYNLE